MSQAREPRSFLAKAKRIVVKIGSRALARDPAACANLAQQLAHLRGQGRSVVLVSSGAIALGIERLGYKQRPKEMGRLQAAAAAGQSLLMGRYDEAFAKHGLVAAQVLLTHADLADRERLNNAREAFAALLDAGAIPIVNENDTVSTDEIKFGDNDQLAAMVAPLVQADLLILLTDVEGVLGPTGNRISLMLEDSEIGQLKPKGDSVGTGGIQSKINAARKGARAGAWVVIAPAMRENIILQVAQGEDLGTLFLPPHKSLRARKHWIAYTLEPRGDVLLDAGAVRAMSTGRVSLLPVGVLGLRGDFYRGDAVRLVAPDGSEIGRGLTRLGALELARAAGHKGEELDKVLGSSGEPHVVVHKDDLVIG